MALELAAEFFTATDCILKIAHTLADRPIADRLAGLAKCLSDVISGFHETPQNLHQLQHGYIAQPMTKNRRPKQGSIHLVSQVRPLAQLLYHEYRNSQQAQDDQSIALGK